MVEPERLVVRVGVEGGEEEGEFCRGGLVKGKASRILGQ